MAYSRDVAHQKCTSIELPLSLHVLKLLIMPDSRDAPYWRREIGAFLRSIVDIRLKPKSRQMTAELYREWLIDEPDLDDAATIERRIGWIKKDYDGESITVPKTVFAEYTRLMDRIVADLGRGVVSEL